MCSRIPEISDDKLHALAKRIKPVGRNRSGKLRYYKKRDPRREAFNFYGESDFRLWPVGNLTEVAKIETWHICGSTMGCTTFMPTVAEVISQIPEIYLKRVVAFETVDHANEESADLIEDGHAYHKTTTVLYARA